MIYKIDLRNDAYGSVDKEWYITSPLNLRTEAGEEKLKEFKKLIDNGVDPAAAVKSALGSESTLLDTPVTISIFY